MVLYTVSFNTYCETSLFLIHKQGKEVWGRSHSEWVETVGSGTLITRFQSLGSELLHPPRACLRLNILIKAQGSPFGGTVRFKFNFTLRFTFELKFKSSKRYWSSANFSFHASPLHADGLWTDWETEILVLQDLRLRQNEMRSHAPGKAPLGSPQASRFGKKMFHVLEPYISTHFYWSLKKDEMHFRSSGKGRKRNTCDLGNYKNHRSAHQETQTVGLTENPRRPAIRRPSPALSASCLPHWRQHGP